MRDSKNSDQYDLEMVNVEIPAYSSDDEDEFDTTDSEYGEDSLHERKITPKTITAAKSSSTAKSDFYKKSLRRQNICFGSSVFALVGMFIAAYFYMDISFSPAEVGIFGDEIAMKGASGEVGLDADNAETQQIIDEEIIALEETGNWGEKAKDKRSKIEDIIFDKDRIGEHKWVEDSDWWKNNIGNMDISNMTKKELKTYQKMKKKEMERKKKKNDEEEKMAKAAKNGKVSKPDKEGQVEGIDDIKQKLANRHHDSNGVGKEKTKHAIDDIYHMKQKHNGVRPDDWKTNNKGSQSPHGEDGKEEQDGTTDIPNDTTLHNVDGEVPTEETNAAETDNEQDSDAANVNEGGDDIEEQDETSNVPKDTRNYFDGDVVPEEETNAEEINEQLEDAEEVNEGEIADGTISTAYTVLEQVSHDNMSFTQGISYCSDGKIYETSGLYGQSKVRRINPNTFEVEKSIDTPKQFFGEGSTCFIGKDGKEYLIEITWREHKGFLYDVPSLELVYSFDYTTTPPGNQGWGITYDRNKNELIVSDGSEYLYFWDVETFREKRKVAVTRFDGRKQDQINELEFMDGLVCYNIWHDDEIICADPETGKSVREYDFSKIWPANQRGSYENVLNGIALGKDHVLITGKRWDRIYKVDFTDWPTLFNK